MVQLNDKNFKPVFISIVNHFLKQMASLESNLSMILSYISVLKIDYKVILSKYFRTLAPSKLAPFTQLATVCSL